jgi:pyruvate/2-oxoglutarate dehydrogenase complex dihydrolipoamide acyltransferase (E2) component
MPRETARDVPGYRRFMPALMPTRTESAVYFDQQVRTAPAEDFIAATRHEHPELHPTFFHLVLWAMARMFDQHPKLNRVLAGGRLYQRDGIWISFTAKTAMTEEGALVEVKHRFDPGQPFAEMVRELQEETSRARSSAHGLADRELELFLHLPPAARRGVVRIASLAHTWGLLPRAFVDGDPFFASAFVTNLGSVGLDAAFHHLYEYGTIPIFCALGAIHEAVVVEDGRPVVARVAPLKFTYDERVEDGLYAAHALTDFCRMLERPSDISGPSLDDTSASGGQMAHGADPTTQRSIA